MTEAVYHSFCEMSIESDGVIIFGGEICGSITVNAKKAVINNTNHHFITVNSAQNVRIVNNVFEDIGELSSIEGRIVDIDTAMNIDISENKYLKYKPRHGINSP